MAGIGFDLRRLVRSGKLLSAASAYGFAAMITAGPWLFTVLSLTGIYLWSRDTVVAEEITTFQVVVTWNFSLSLVLSGAVVLAATRYLADCIHRKSYRRAPGLMLTALGMVYAISVPVALPLYGHFLDLPMATRVVALANFFLVAGIWVVTLFLSALKDYGGITLIFGVGMATSFLAGSLAAEHYGAIGMLAGFSLGLLLIQFTIIARVFVEYGGTVRWPDGFGASFRQYWELALGGLLFSAAIWVDKWVMWFAPERQIIAGGLAFNRYYDTAMFLACLTAIPAMAMFTVSGETGLFERLRAFFRDIHAHAPYARIAGNQKEIIHHVEGTFRAVIPVQAAVSAIAVFLAPQVIALAGGGYLHLGMFRLGVLGALFFTLSLLVSIILAYIDHRRPILMLQALFLVLNGTLTVVSMHFGFAWYGAGFFAASMITFVVGYAVLMHALRDLPYLVFVKNNPSISQRKEGIMTINHKSTGRRWRPAFLAGVLLMVLGVAFPAQGAVLDLRVLLISSGTAAEDAGLDLMDDMLDTMGVPYDVLDASRENLTAGMLSSGNNGFYNGVILTSTDLYTAGGSAFTLEEWQTLHAYERTFGVRESVISGWPTTWPEGLDLDYGLTNIQGGAVFDANWVAPAGGGELFEYVNTANPLPVTDWSFSGQPRNDGTGPTVTPLLVKSTDPSQVLISLLNYPDGRQVMLSTISNAWFLIHSQVLAYEFLDFATQGVFQGARQVYLAAHVDDIFDGSPLWDKDANVTDESVEVRITPDDVSNVVSAQQALENTFPTVANFELDFAFNGIGADKENDPLTKRIVEDKERFRFINHTWSHMDMDASAGTTYDMARQEIRSNMQLWNDLSLPDYKRNRRVLISGGHSGVYDDMGTELDLSDDIPYPDGINPQFMQAAQDQGVRYLAADPSRPNQGVESYVPGYNILLLPRWPTSVFYNTPDPQTLEDEYNYIFYERYLEDGINPCTVPAAICWPRNYAQILDAEAETTLRHLLSYKAWPHYFHQANLRMYNSAGDTLQFDWLHAVLSRYEELITLPIINVPYHEIGRITKNRVDAQSANVLAQWNTDTGQVTITADRGTRVMFTGLSGGEVYGGERIREVRIKDEPRTYSVDQMLIATGTLSSTTGVGETRDGEHDDEEHDDEEHDDD